MRHIVKTCRHLDRSCVIQALDWRERVEICQGRRNVDLLITPAAKSQRQQISSKARMI
jgi:hypothetical protein